MNWLIQNNMFFGDKRKFVIPKESLLLRFLWNDKFKIKLILFMHCQAEVLEAHYK